MSRGSAREEAAGAVSLGRVLSLEARGIAVVWADELEQLRRAAKLALVAATAARSFDWGYLNNVAPNFRKELAELQKRHR